MGSSPVLDLVLVAARLALATVFVVAGIAKLADRQGSREALAGFGVPRSLAPAAALLLPVGELAIALALLGSSTARLGGLGALCLLLVFIAAIAHNLARGRQVDCHCFGQLHSAPAGPRTLARNAFLAAVAVLVAIAGSPKASPSALGMAVIAVAILTLSATQRLRRRVPARLHAPGNGDGGGSTRAGVGSTDLGLAVGSQAPAFALEDLDGARVSLQSLLSSGKSTMLVFTSPQCGPCNALLPELAGWQAGASAQLRIVLVSSGALADNRAKAAEHRLTSVLVEPDRSVSQSYRVPGTPSAVAISPDGLIASPIAPGAEAIRGLVAQMARDQHEPMLLVQHEGDRLDTAGSPTEPAALFTLPLSRRRALAIIGKAAGMFAAFLATAPAAGATESDKDKDPCKPLGRACRTNQSCCSGICDNRTCVACRPTSSTCSSNGECCSGICDNGTCVCRPTGSCSSNGECCSGICDDFGFCQPTCAEEHFPCEIDSQCCAPLRCLGSDEDPCAGRTGCTCGFTPF